MRVTSWHGHGRPPCRQGGCKAPARGARPAAAERRGGARAVGRGDLRKRISLCNSSSKVLQRAAGEVPAGRQALEALVMQPPLAAPRAAGAVLPRAQVQQHVVYRLNGSTVECSVRRNAAPRVNLEKCGNCSDCLLSRCSPHLWQPTAPAPRPTCQCCAWRRQAPQWHEAALERAHSAQESQSIRLQLSSTEMTIEGCGFHADRSTYAMSREIHRTCQHM